MMPLTKTLPKPLLEYSGEPILERILYKLKLEVLKHNNIYQLSRQKIQKYFKNVNNLDLNIQYIKETKEMGTAGSLEKLKNLNNNLPILISNADLITNLNFKDLLNYHNDNLSEFTIASKNMSIKILWSNS